MYTLKISVMESPAVKDRLQKAAAIPAIHHMEKKLTTKTSENVIDTEHQSDFL